MADSASESEPLLAETGSITNSIEGNAPDLNRNSCCSKNIARTKLCFLIEPVLMLYFFCEYPLMLATQRYIIEWTTEEFIARDLLRNITHGYFNQSPCDVNISYSDYLFQQSIQKTSSHFLIIKSMVWTIPAIFVTLSLGSSSDRVGRRVAIIPPLIGSLLVSCIIAIITWFKASILWLLIGDLLYGCSGSFTCIISGSIAFAVDQTTPERRMHRITIIQLCIMISATVSPLLYGPLLDIIGIAQTIFIIVLISACNALYCFIFLPNNANNTRIKTDPDSKQSNNNDQSAQNPVPDDSSGLTQLAENPVPTSSLIQRLVIQIKICYYLFIKKPSSTTLPCTCATTTTTTTTCQRSCSCSYSSKQRLKLRILLAAFFVTTIPSFDATVVTLFEMNSPLCWSMKTIGIYSGMSVGVATIGAMIVIPLMKRCLTDHTIALIAGIACIANRVYLSFVDNSLMMFLSSSLAMFCILLMPSIRSLMSLLVSEKEQGAVFSVIAAVEVVCFLLGSLIFNLIYSATLLIATSFVFLISGLFYVVGTFLLIVYKVIIRRETTPHQCVVIENTIE